MSGEELYGMFVLAFKEMDTDYPIGRTYDELQAIEKLMYNIVASKLLAKGGAM